MPQALLDYLWMDTRREQQGRGAVAEVVKPLSVESREFVQRPTRTEAVTRRGTWADESCGALRTAHGMYSFAGNRWATAWQRDRASIRNTWRPGEESNPRPVA